MRRRVQQPVEEHDFCELCWGTMAAAVNRLAIRCHTEWWELSRESLLQILPGVWYPGYSRFKPFFAT